jgi:hypothetical protein
VGPLGGFWFSLFRFPWNLDSDSVTLLGAILGVIESLTRGTTDMWVPGISFFTRHAHLNNLSNE